MKSVIQNVRNQPWTKSYHHVHNHVSDQFLKKEILGNHEVFLQVYNQFIAPIKNQLNQLYE